MQRTDFRQDTGGVGRKERVRRLEREAWKHTLLCVKETAKGHLLSELKPKLRNKLKGWGGRALLRGGDVCAPMADSC